MKLCLLLGMLTVAFCKSNDVINEPVVSTSVAFQENGTTVSPREPPPGTSKSIKKRQTGSIKSLGTTDGNKEWNIDPNPYGIPKEKDAMIASWTGRRTSELNLEPPEFSKRAKFSTWAGERNDPLDLSEKQKFLSASLAGLVPDPSEDYSSANDVESDKFEEFHPDKRSKFSSWGGKRGDASHENKRKFSSWSGKRNFNQNPFIDPNTNRFFPEDQDMMNMNKAENVIKTALLNPAEKNTADVHDNFNTKELFELNNNAIDNPEYWTDDDSDLNQEKRTKFSSWGGKRKFSSWGGKRSEYVDIAPSLDDSPLIYKRAQFSSWAGKRGLLPLWKIKYRGKRSKFLNWPGNQNDYSIDDLLEQDKRGRFSSWGGKRGFLDQSDSYEEKRGKFSSWAGKRFDDENDEDFNADKRDVNGGGLKKKIRSRGFSSWGGKRSNLDNDGTTDHGTQGFGTDFFDNEKRATKFSSWGGKRSQDIVDEKRKFSSWGGKRDYFPLMNEETKRAKFSSWGGKRSVNPDEGPEENSSKDNRNYVLTRRLNKLNTKDSKEKTQLNSTRRTELGDVNFNQSGNTLGQSKSKRGITNYIKQFEMIKRNPLLRAWIGKNYPDIGLLTWKRRPAFSSWGGKRSLNSEEEKRTRFSNWGGKRHAIEKRSVKMPTSNIFKKLNPDKKDARSLNLLGTRTPLESRFYLRSSKDGMLAPVIRPMRRQFYAWGGKRASQS